jgi:hypothetical protein
MSYDCCGVWCVSVSVYVACTGLIHVIHRYTRHQDRVMERPTISTLRIFSISTDILLAGPWTGKIPSDPDN